MGKTIEKKSERELTLWELKVAKFASPSKKVLVADPEFHPIIKSSEAYSEGSVCVFKFPGKAISYGEILKVKYLDREAQKSIEFDGSEFFDMGRPLRIFEKTVSSYKAAE